jgi:hypothetical protein
MKRTLIPVLIIGFFLSVQLLDPLNHVNLGTNSLQATSFQSLEYYYETNQRPQLLIEFQ